MPLHERIFGAIWALWGFMWFMLVAAVLTPVYAIVLLAGGKKYAIQCVWINYSVASPFLLAINGIRVRVHGKEKINPAQTYVFVANHLAQIDIIAGASATPKPAKFLAKSETRYIPIFGYMVKMLGIVVDRKSKESREKSYQYMRETLQQGESLFIYPEGTRNRTEAPLKEFKDGAFKAAIMAQVPIAVQTLVNTRNLNDPRYIHLKPGVVDVYWSEPIETKGMTLEDIPALKERVRAEMMKHLQ